jgi:hypothetical protein
MADDAMPPDPDAVPYVNPDDFFYGPKSDPVKQPWTKLDTFLQTAADYAQTTASKLSGALKWLYDIWKNPAYWWAQLGIIAGVVFLIVFALFGPFGGGKSTTPQTTSAVIKPTSTSPASPQAPSIQHLKVSVQQDGKILSDLGVSNDVVRAAENITLINEGTPLAAASTQPALKRNTSGLYVVNPSAVPASSQKGLLFISSSGPTHYADISHIDGAAYIDTLQHRQSVQDTTVNSAVVHGVDVVAAH